LRLQPNITRIVAFLAGDDDVVVTGAALLVDGGMALAGALL